MNCALFGAPKAITSNLLLYRKQTAPPVPKEWRSEDKSLYQQMTFFDPTEFRAMVESAPERDRFATAYPSARSLFEAYLEATPRSLPHFPRDGLTALQFTLFDNGEESSAKKHVGSTKSRFGLNVKAWDRPTIDWTKAHQVAWEGNSALHEAALALAIARRLHAKKLLPGGVDEALAKLIRMAEGEGLFGIFHQRKPGLGTRWSEAIVHIRWDEDRWPRAAFLVLPDLCGYETVSFEPTTATGSRLGGNAIAQARVAYHDALSGWATDLTT